jgi:hypothetical protein
MGTDCATSQVGFGGLQKKPTEARIERVANGFIINFRGVEQKIANTLPEALELVRKELE